MKPASELPVDALARALAAELAEPVARRVAELLREAPRPGRLLDAAELADYLGVERGWVYEHAEELGVVRIGDGQRPRLRFDADRALAARQHWEAHAEPEPAHATPRRRARTNSAELLPIRGKAA